jgi:hypothetical protein
VGWNLEEMKQYFGACNNLTHISIWTGKILKPLFNSDGKSVIPV